MAVQRFRVYDVIVDLLPGLVFLILVIPLFPIATETILRGLEMGLGAGLVVLLVAYVAGRFLHTLAAHSTVESLRRGWDVVILELREKRSSSLSDPPSFERRLNTASDESGRLEPYIHQALVQEIERHYGLGQGFVLSEQGSEEQNNSSNNTDKWCDNEEYVKYLLQSMLSERDSLYHTYVIMATFFRSIWLLMTLSIVGYGLVYLLGHAGYWQSLWYGTIPYKPGSIWHYVTGVAVPIGFLLLSFLADNRRLEFKHRRIRALINDSFRILRTEQDTQPRTGS